MPLTNLLRKNTNFIWNMHCQHAFENLKALLTNYPILYMPDYNKPFELKVDASNSGVGAVLMQKIKDDDHPISYFSKKFNKHQLNYSTIEKEALALILSLEHYDIYLSSTPFQIKVYTDHNPLTFINNMKNKNQRLSRWSIILQNFNISIHHVKGSENLIPDTLSRA